MGVESAATAAAAAVARLKSNIKTVPIYTER